MVQGKGHSATGKPKVAEMIGVDVRVAVGLKGGSYMAKTLYCYCTTCTSQYIVPYSGLFSRGENVMV